jgi:hypothetical protein
MPTIYSVAAASAQGFGNQLNVVPVPGPIGSYNVIPLGTSSGSPFFFPYSSFFDSSNNVYIVGNATLNTIGSYTCIIKMDKTGNVLWSYYCDETYNSGGYTDISGNTYLLGYDSTGKKYFIAKINSSGSLVYQKTFSVTYFNDSFYLKGQKVDSSGNLYLIGYGQNNSPQIWAAYVIKINSAGINLRYPARIT